MLRPVGAKRGFSGLKDHGMSAQRDATVCHGVNVTLPLATPVIKRGIEKKQILIQLEARILKPAD